MDELIKRINQSIASMKNDLNDTNEYISNLEDVLYTLEQEVKMLLEKFNK